MNKMTLNLLNGVVVSDAEGARPRINITRTDQTMSWLRPGLLSKGSAYFSATSGANNGVLELVASEDPYYAGRKRRRVMLELTRDQAIALRDFLVEQVK